MRTSVRTVAGLLLAAWTATALAQEGPKKAVIGEKAPDLLVRESDKKDKPEPLLEKHRNKIIVLFFFRTTDGASTEAIPKLKKLHKDLGKRGVTIIVISDEKKEKVESFVKGKEYEGEFKSDVNLEEPYDVAAVPQVYLIDANGILVNHFHPLDDMEERIVAQMKKTPPAGADPEALKARLAQAKKEFDAKQYGRAYTLAKEVSSLAEKETPLGETTTKLLEQIQEAAKKWLDEGKQAATAKSYDKACSILAELSVRFQGTAVGTDADTELGRLRGMHKLKAEVRKAVDNAKGQLLIDEANEQMAAKRFLDALKPLREVLEKYPDTEAAKAAEKNIDQINSNPKAQEAIRTLRAEEEAERWLDIADRFAKVKMYKKAREYYTKVAETHPESRAAAKTKDRLKDLPEDETEDEPVTPAADQDAAKGSGDKK